MCNINIPAAAADRDSIQAVGGLGASAADQPQLAVPPYGRLGDYALPHARLQ